MPGMREAVEQHVLDQKYLNFLEEQIRLSPRGPKWAEVLRKRHDVLAAKMLLSGIGGRSSDNCYVKLDPESRKRVLYWE